MFNLKRLAAAGGLLVLLLGAALVAPRYVGARVMDTIEANVAELDAAPGYSATVTDTRRGWFSSEVRWTLHSASATRAPGSGSGLPLLVRVQHGPWLFDADGWFGLANLAVTPDVRDRPAWQQPLATAGIPHWVHVAARIDNDGNARIHAHMPAHTGAGYSFAGAQARLRWDQSSRRLAGSFSAPGFSLDEAPLRLDATQLSGTLDIHHWNDLLYVGNVNTTINRIEMRSGEQHIRVDGLDFDTDTRVDDETTMTAGMRYAIGQLTVNNTLLADLVLDIAWRRFNVEFVTRWMASVDRLASGGAPDDAATLAAVDALLSSAGPQLLAGSPALEINQLSFKYAGETSTLSAVASIDGDDLPASIPWQDTRFWLRSLDVEAFAIAPRNVAQLVAAQIMTSTLTASLADNPRPARLAALEALRAQASEQAPQLLDALTEQGILTLSDAGYRTRLRMRDGAMELNGRPIPLPDISRLQRTAHAW